MEDAPDIRTPYVQVKLHSCRTLAVFRRLIVDEFTVVPNGNKFTSTAHDLVKVTFPGGAVDETSLIKMKVKIRKKLLMIKNILIFNL